MSDKKFKFNLVDAIIVLIVVAAVAVVGVKVAKSGAIQGNSAQYEVTYFCEEAPTFAAEIIKVGDKVSDEQKDTDLGVVTNVVLGPSRSYATTDDGDILCKGKEGYNSVEITTTLNGEHYEHGVVVGSSKYGVGHSITIRAGKAKIFGRVSGIEIKE